MTTTNPNIISNLNYRPEFLEGQDETNYKTLTEYGHTVNAQIEAMQRQREGWRGFLQKLYEDDVIQDEKVRELRCQVMMGEAEAMANPAFHRWLKDREQHGVGSEKIDAWYTIDSLLAHTPYLCTIPCPRNLSEKGWAMVEDTVKDMFDIHDDQEAQEENENGGEQISTEQKRLDNNNQHHHEEFSLEWWPVLQHQNGNTSNNNESEEIQQATTSEPTSSWSVKNNRRCAADSSFACSSKNGHLKQVFEANPTTLQRALVETPCFLIGDKTCTSRLASPFSSPLIVYVVRGTLIAVESYYAPTSSSSLLCSSSTTTPVKFPTYLSPTVVAGSTTPITSSNCKAILQLRSWLQNVTLESLPERSFTAVVMMTCLSSTQVSFSLLNLAPLDAVGSSNFAWSDIIGLIVNAHNKRETLMNDFERSHPEQMKNLDEALASGEVVLPAAPSVEVVFRGSWIKVDPEDDECIKAILMNEQKEKNKNEDENNNNNNNKSNTQSSGFSTSTLLALAAGACVASVSIGISLGLKIAQNNNNKK